MITVAGDIGGTNARLALVERAPKGGPRILQRASYPSAEYPGLAPILKQFLEEVGAATPARARYGVACPIVKGACKTPNLPWTLDTDELIRDTGVADTVLINDFTALALGVPHLAPADLHVLEPGAPEAHGPIALLGAGTGLGEGFMVWDGAGYRVLASEGGHALFTPRTQREWGLAEWLRREHGRATWERVLSGAGLENIYRFLVDDERRFSAPVITKHALDKTDPVCIEALDMFAGAYGSLAGQLALTAVATGGVYLGGGIAPRILPKLNDGTFSAAFLDQELGELIAKIPAYVITNTDVGLLGAAALAVIGDSR